MHHLAKAAEADLDQEMNMVRHQADGMAAVAAAQQSDERQAKEALARRLIDEYVLASISTCDDVCEISGRGFSTLSGHTYIYDGPPRKVPSLVEDRRILTANPDEGTVPFVPFVFARAGGSAPAPAGPSTLPGAPHPAILQNGA